MCQHQPPCPTVDSAGREAARLTVHHPEQGWSLLCNGVLLFEVMSISRSQGLV